MTVNTDGSRSRRLRRRRHRRGEGALLRDEVLDATATLLAERGDSREVTIRAVAERAGVTSPSIYRHFTDKADLLRAVVEARFEHFRTTMRAAEETSTDPCDALRRRCHAYVRYAQDHPGHYRLLFSAMDLGPAPLGLPEGMEHPGRASFEDHVRAVVRCLEQGKGPHELESTVTALLLWTQLHGIADLRISKPEMPWPPAEDLVDAALAALALR
jgi:AcrR family transcriptional regulator